MLHGFKYYRRSKIGCWIALALLGCAGPNAVARDAPTIEFEQLRAAPSSALAQQLGQPPYIIKFEAGEEIPVDFVLESTLLATRDEDFVLIAKRDVYLLIRDDGPPVLSADGVQFEAKKKNWFRFGFRVTKREPSSIDLGLGLHPER